MLLTGYTHCNWRLPTLGELRQILVGPAAVSTQTQTCTTVPCIDAGFSAVGGPATSSSRYWSASSYFANTFDAWGANFGTGLVNIFFKTSDVFVRAVRAGSCSS